jgi:electron transport complex protein RnfC
MYIESFAQSGDYLGAEKYGAMNCIECGSCAYNCPAKRPLVQTISLAKAKIKEMKKNGK